MVTLSLIQENPPSENPYAAPQTRDLVSPAALEVAEALTTRSEEVLPRSTQRWLNAALGVYWLAFVVPMFRAWDSWLPLLGGLMFFVGAVMCWHPLAFSWWANVFFWLSRRNLHGGRSQRSCVYAGLGVLAAAMFPLLGIWDGNPNFILGVTLNPPYFCWLAAMILQWIAAVDMRQYNRNHLDELAAREVM